MGLLDGAGLSGSYDVTGDRGLVSRDVMWMGHVGCRHRGVGSWSWTLDVGGGGWGGGGCWGFVGWLLVLIYHLGYQAESMGK